MMTCSILHNGWRANDVLLEDDSNGLATLVYYTHRRQEGITSTRIGVALYKNERVFLDKHRALLWYMTNEYRRWSKIKTTI